jgi:hypothetical protein
VWGVRGRPRRRLAFVAERLARRGFGRFTHCGAADFLGPAAGRFRRRVPDTPPPGPAAPCRRSCNRTGGGPESLTRRTNRRVRKSGCNGKAMLAAGRQHTDREWAVEGCNGIGRHVAQRLVADGETVVDVPAKLSARARVFTTGQGRKTDPVDARGVAVVALRTPGLRRVQADDTTVALRLLVDRRDSSAAPAPTSSTDCTPCCSNSSPATPRKTWPHKPHPRVCATIGSPLPAVGLDIHLCSLSGGYELPLLVGPAVCGPLHDLRPVAGRGGVDVGCQSVVAADDGVVAVTGGP